MFESAMRFLVGIIMLCFAAAKSCHMFLQVCLCEKKAGAVWTFDEAVAVLLSHIVAPNGCL